MHQTANIHLTPQTGGFACEIGFIQKLRGFVMNYFSTLKLIEKTCSFSRIISLFLELSGASPWAGLVNQFVAA